MMLGTALAVLAITAVGASAAQAATEGPFYKVAGVRLAAAETKNVSGKGAGYQYGPGLGIVVSCTHTEIAKGSKFLGSSGANASGSEQTIASSGCTVQNLPGCRVEGEKVTLNPLKGTLGFANASRTGKLLELFKPVTGKILASIQFTGTRAGEECSVSKLNLEGSTIADVGTYTSPVEVGTEKQASIGALVFPTTKVKALWTESAGKLTEVKAKLEDSGVVASMSGESQLEAEGLPEWGVFTK